MKRVAILALLVILLMPVLSRAQTVGVWQNWCQAGGVQVLLSGLQSTNLVQGSYPQCTVTVFLTGTQNKATLYANLSLQALSNPFTANADASFLFYASTSNIYDVVITGGQNGGLPAPYTFFYTTVSTSGGGGGGGSGIASSVQTLDTLPSFCSAGTSGVPTGILAFATGGSSFLAICTSTNQWGFNAGFPNGTVGGGFLDIAASTDTGRASVLLGDTVSASGLGMNIQVYSTQANLYPYVLHGGDMGSALLNTSPGSDTTYLFGNPLQIGKAASIYSLLDVTDGFKISASGTQIIGPLLDSTGLAGSDGQFLGKTSGAVVWSTPGGGGGGPGTGTQNQFAYWATTNTLGSVGSTISNQIAVIQNGAPPVAASVGVPGSTVSAGPYGPTGICDSATTTLARATVVTFTNAVSTAVTMPDAGTSGCSSNFVMAMVAGAGAGTVTVSRNTTSTFTIVDGSTATTGATSFTLTAGQYATLSSPDNANWLVRKVAGGGGSGANTALSNLVAVSINTSLLAQTGVSLGSFANSFQNLFLYGGGTYGTNGFELTGTSTGAPDVISLPDVATGTLLSNNGVNTAQAAMTLDLSGATGATAFKVPVLAGATAGANGVIDYDSTNGNTHIRTNGADSIAVAEAAALAANAIPAATDATHGLLQASHLTDGAPVSNSAGLQFSGASGAATTISTSTTNANLILAPNGTGGVVFNQGANANPSILISGGAANTGLNFPTSSAMCFVTGGTCQLYFTSASFALASGNAVSFTSGAQASGTKDTTISRIATGNVMLGNGTAGDVAAPNASYLLRAQGVSSGTSNVTGPDLLLASGLSTGTGTCGRTVTQSSIISLSGGLGQNAVKTSSQWGNCKSMSTTSATAQTIMTPTLTSLQSGGGILYYLIHVDNSTDICQVHGSVNWNLVNKSGAYSANVSSPTEASLITGAACGVMSTSWAWSTNNLQVTPTFSTITATHAYMYWSSTNESDGSLP